MKMVTRELTKAVTHTRDDGTVIVYPAGFQAMPEADAEHWYIAAHTKQAPAPALGDRQFAVSLREAADAKYAEYINLAEQAEEAERAYADAQRAARERAGLIAGVSMAQPAAEPATAGQDGDPANPDGDAGEQAGQDGEGGDSPGSDADGEGGADGGIKRRRVRRYQAAARAAAACG